MSEKCIVNLSFDWDGESMWAGPGKPDSPSLVSRGAYAANIAIPRIKALLDKHDIKATFFIPGYTAELHADMVKELHDEGHEIGHHNYYHNKMVNLTEAEEREVLEKGIDALFKITGEKPGGWRCPGWGTSPRTLDLLGEYGFVYDSSLMDDEVPYVLTTPSGNATMVEIPVCWELDDAPYFLFSFFPNYIVGLADPKRVLAVWKAEFEAAYETMHFFSLTMHPQVIGRVHRFQILEELVEFIKSRDDVVFQRYIDIARALLSE
jgi:peptidoglycan/xylan/chitin deacetylase (PgdA/CDA1 family)